MFKFDVRKRSYNDMAIPNDFATDWEVVIMILKLMQRLIWKALKGIGTRQLEKVARRLDEHVTISVEKRWSMSNSKLVDLW